MKKILITGASSFIGKNLVPKLKKYNNKCLVRKKINLQNCEQILFTIDNIKEEVFKDIDYIIHIAGITNSNDPLIEKVNTIFTKKLVNLSKKYKIKFIYISSDNVNYSIKDKYTITKTSSEKIIKNNLKNYLIIRPVIIYGKGENKYVGKLISIIKKSPVTPILGSGNSKIQLIHIDDLTDFIASSLNIKGTYTLNGPEATTYNKLVDLISKKLNKKVIKLHIPILLITPLIKIYQLLVKKPFITTQQLKNIKIKRGNIKNEFKLKNPVSINQGLDKTL